MSVRIRAAVPTDARAIAELHVASWQATYRGQLTDGYLDGLSVEDRLRSTRDSIERAGPGRRTWIVEEGEQVLGFAVTGSSEDADADADRQTGEVYAIYLDPERVGTGAGRALFAHVVGDLRERGYLTATLWVLESNERARRFYEAAGWAPDGTVATECVDCEMRPTIRYRADLV